MGGKIHDAFPTLLSIALLPAAPRFIFGCCFCGADQGCSIQPNLINIKDEDAVPIERDFFRLPAGIVAVVGVPTEVTDPGSSDKVVVIGRDPLFDGLPGRFDGLFHVGLV